MPIAAIATVAGFIVAFVCLLLVPHQKAPMKTLTRKLLVSGTPVVVSTTHFWAECATGAVWMPPEGVKHLAPEWVDVARTLKTGNTSYWVVFDEPQLYPDGDGPFIAAELPAEALEPMKAVGGKAPTSKRRENFGPGELVFSWFENGTSGLRVEFKMKRRVNPFAHSDVTLN